MVEHHTLFLFHSEMRRIRGTAHAKDEVSYYPALEMTFNAVGKALKPAVVAIQHPKGKKGDHPDLGLFEFGHAKATADWVETPIPSRGVVEAKPLSYDIEVLQASDQVRDYLKTFGAVLITNFREFRLLERVGKKILIREQIILAPTEARFWALKANEKRAAVTFSEFIHRVLLHNAPLRAPEDVAFFLASYAREAMAELEQHSSLPAVANLREALEKTLGFEFRQAEGERLFRSTLVQTLFYGLFSAWVLRSEKAEGGAFNWKNAGWDLTVPVVQMLFAEAAAPHRLGTMLAPLLDRASAKLSGIVGQNLTDFLASFHSCSAMIYFYEPFLKAFDAETRERLGVWYTPPEIVRYMVERIDRVLRTDLGRPDGLADPNVWILDPCCGTGSFVVEVLRRIRQTWEEQGKGVLVGSMLRDAAMTRIVGFEIMTAPLVIAHWKVAEVLRDANSAFDAEKGERAAIYLTNSLTGWTPPAGAVPHLPGFDKLEEERDLAAAVKREKPILVVLGNPPYNAYAGTSPDEEQNLVGPYKKGLQEEWGIHKFNLDELYVRFFRIAERRIKFTGQGIICFISNSSWITERSFVVMRQNLVNTFNRAWIENMHGNRKISERGPDGRTSQTVFAMKGLSPGIRQSVAISLLARTGKSDRHYGYRDDIAASDAETRRAQLLGTLTDADFEKRYERVGPSEENWFRLRPGEAAEEYASWASLPDLCRVPPLNGPMEKRGGALIDYDRAELEARMRVYCDLKATEAAAKEAVPQLMVKHARFEPMKTRRTVQAVEGYKPSNLVPYVLRPFDLGYAYVSRVRPLWNEPRPDLLHILPKAEGFLASRPAGVAEPEGWPVLWTRRLGDDHALRADAFYVPLVENLSGAPRPNISEAAAGYLVSLELPSDPRTLWMHFLAVAYSAAWLTDHAHGIRYDWPRVPLPDNASHLLNSAKLGATLAALLDPDTAVPGVTTGTIRAELREIAVLDCVVKGKPDLAVSAGWASKDQLGRVNPGKGKVVERPYDVKREARCAEKGPLLGGDTLDVFLNNDTYWRNVPRKVWETYIGGYQVLKKWLSYRERAILARPLNSGEADYVTQTCRRLGAILLLGPTLDDNYRRCAESHAALTATEEAREPV